MGHLVRGARIAAGDCSGATITTSAGSILHASPAPMTDGHGATPQRVSSGQRRRNSFCMVFFPLILVMAGNLPCCGARVKTADSTMLGIAGQSPAWSPNRPRYCAGDGMGSGSAGEGPRDAQARTTRRSMPRWVSFDRTNEPVQFTLGRNLESIGDWFKLG